MDAIEEFYATGFSSAKKYILNKGGSVEDAKDIYQDSIILFLEKIKDPNFKLEVEIEAYIMGIVKNLHLTQNRKTNIERLKLEKSNFLQSILTEEEVIWIEMATEKLSIFLENIGSPCFEILNQFYFKKWSMKQIAENLGYSNEDTAKTTKNRCMQKLKMAMVTNNY